MVRTATYTTNIRGETRLQLRHKKPRLRGQRALFRFFESMTSGVEFSRDGLVSLPKRRLLDLRSPSDVSRVASRTKMTGRTVNELTP